MNPFFSSHDAAMPAWPDDETTAMDRLVVTPKITKRKQPHKQEQKPQSPPPLVHEKTKASVDVVMVPPPPSSLRLIRQVASCWSTETFRDPQRPASGPVAYEERYGEEPTARYPHGPQAQQAQAQRGRRCDDEKDDAVPLSSPTTVVHNLAHGDEMESSSSTSPPLRWHEFRDRRQQQQPSDREVTVVPCGKEVDGACSAAPVVPCEEDDGDDLPQSVLIPRRRPSTGTTRVSPQRPLRRRTLTQERRQDHRHRQDNDDVLHRNDDDDDDDTNDDDDDAGFRPPPPVTTATTTSVATDRAVRDGRPPPSLVARQVDPVVLHVSHVHVPSSSSRRSLFRTGRWRHQQHHRRSESDLSYDHQHHHHQDCDDDDVDEDRRLHASSAPDLMYHHHHDEDEDDEEVTAVKHPLDDTQHSGRRASAFAPE